MVQGVPRAASGGAIMRHDTSVHLSVTFHAVLYNLYPFLGKAVTGRASYLDNMFCKNEKLIGFGIGAAPRAQIRGLFVFTKGVIEIFSILVEIARR